MPIQGIHAQGALELLDARQLAGAVWTEKEIQPCRRHDGWNYQLSTLRSTMRRARSVRARLKAAVSLSALAPNAKYVVSPVNPCSSQSTVFVVWSINFKLTTMFNRHSSTCCEAS